MNAEDLFQKILPPWRAAVGPVIGLDFFDRFVASQRPALIAILQTELDAKRARRRSPSPTYAASQEPFDDSAASSEEWSVAKRTAANLEALRLLERLGNERVRTSHEREILAGYSGWGGLSIEKIKDRLPAGVEVDTFGLTNEYYTPASVCNEIARELNSYLAELAVDGLVRALEPAAGIGRMIRPFTTGRADAEIAWMAIEYSPLSAKILAALYQTITAVNMPFERWVQEHARKETGLYRLVVCNPPYGKQGVHITEDEDRSYRESTAHGYFLRRGLSMLGEGGIGAYLVPAGVLDASDQVALRTKLLRQNHLMAAFRLPSLLPNNRSLFPGASLIIDLQFWKARGGTLPMVDAADKFIAQGRYFKQFPQFVLGEVSKDGRGRDIVRGEFTRLPSLKEVERPICSGCRVQVPARPVEPDADTLPPRAVGARSVVRRLEADTEGLKPELAQAALLGVRVDAYFAALGSDDQTASELWFELSEALTAWTEANGNPWKHLKLRELADRGNIGAQRFLTAFAKNGELVPALQRRPVVQARYNGRPEDVLAQAEMLYRSARHLTIAELVAFHPTVGGYYTQAKILEILLAGGWCLDGTGWNELVPEQDYQTGELWPKYDRAVARKDDQQAERQAKALLGIIKPVLFEDIDEHITPRESWLPLEIIEAWMTASLNRREPVRLVRENGLTLPYGQSLIAMTDSKGAAKEVAKIEKELAEKEALLAKATERVEESAREKEWSAEYEAKKEKRKLQKSLEKRKAKIEEVRKEAGSILSAEGIWFLGWVNHDMTTFKPPAGKDEKLDDVRVFYQREWISKFRAWLSKHPERRDQIRDIYNRTFRGFVQPAYSTEPLPIARYGVGAHQPHPWQVAGARRVLANRGGLVAFDVGVGKTLTALVIIGRARQEGWSRRPVILVPTSLAWKWVRDVQRTYPDYRIGVVGSKVKMLTARSEGYRSAFARLQAGLITQEEFDRAITTSENDTPEERAAVWTQLQSGQLDVVILTFDAMQRTRMNSEAVLDYVRKTSAIQRSIEIQLRNMEGRKNLTERQKAVKEHGFAGWVAQRMELPEGWQYDPGIAWDDIGIDMLVVDEAAAFKNLYLPEPREFGIPRFMGNPGDGSKRAWQLDFRVNAIHQRTGGTGIVLLTATPAKNSPLEYYNMLQYIDRTAFTQRGIHDPEQFIDRYLKINFRQVISVTGDIAKRSAVDGFIHLDELRDILFKYAEFQSVVGLNKKYPEHQIRLPELQIPQCGVELDDDQEAKYVQMVAQMEAMVESKETGQLLGLLARLSLIAVHAQLDEGYGWNTALHGGKSTRHVAETSLPNWLERGWQLVASPIKGEPLPVLEEHRGTDRSGAKLFIIEGDGIYGNARAAAIDIPAEVGGGGKRGVKWVVRGHQGLPDEATHALIGPDLHRFQAQEYLLAKGVSFARFANDSAEDEGENEGVETVTVQKMLAKPKYSSPKFTACAKRIMKKFGCGHIVFCEPVATHQWLREILVEHGVPRERIAILNAIATKQSAERQRVAEDFNAGLYDVVIANSVAYEGVDLQRRTCAIHHIDFPWTPADIEQRNGRGYRQGNQAAKIEVVYYRAERSLDGFRYNMITNKAAWQDELIYGEARETNNPGAQFDLPADEILVMISRNPAKTRDKLEKARAEAEAERLKVVAKQAARIMNQAAARMKESRATTDMSQAARLRGEAEMRLGDLQKIDPAAWPWAPWSGNVRLTNFIVPPDGQSPVFEGLRYGKENWNGELEFHEFGRLIEASEDAESGTAGGQTIGLRKAGEARWEARDLHGVVNLDLSAQDLEAGAAWPDDESRTASSIRAELDRAGHRVTWAKFGWRLASDQFISVWWPRFGVDIMKILLRSVGDEDRMFPVMRGSDLTLVLKDDVEERLEAGGAVLAPNQAGFDRYVKLAPASGYSFFELNDAALFWWGRPFVRGFLTAARVAKEAEERGTVSGNAESLPRWARQKAKARSQAAPAWSRR